MVRPMRSGCCAHLRTREERTTFRRIGARYPTLAERESKVTTLRTHLKNENQLQQDVAIECQL